MPSSSPPVPSALVVSGLTELALGALSGWVYTVAVKRPDLLRRIGIGSPARIRQWHLDLGMLGAYSVVCGLAVPDAPRSVTLALGVGAWTNAMSFLPLAFDEELVNRPAYLVPVVGSFVATSVGFTGMAATAWRRRRSL
ncbi:MAG TPA: hypothetical protein VLR26_00110 [Frankiaceae bacterium]|nr:hypothetical protein [Frankiaceae bacterium]